MTVRATPVIRLAVYLILDCRVGTLTPPLLKPAVPMYEFIIFTLVLALVASAAALAREVRVRRALERLCRLLMSRWRCREAAPPDDINSDSDRQHDVTRLR